MVNGYASGTSSYTLRAIYTTSGGGGGGGTGTIQVNGTLNGNAWSGPVSYNFTGAASLTGSAVPASGQNVPTGSYTLSYSSGGPSGAVLSSITPSPTQTLRAGATITFTLNFTSSGGGGGGVTPLSNNVPVSDSVAQNQQRHYRISVPAGATQLRVEINGTNDADLYVKYEGQASFSNWDCRPYLVGSDEVCVFSGPPSGDWYIMIDGYGAGSSAYTLRATYTTGFASTIANSEILSAPAIIARVRVGVAPEGVAVSHDNRRIYVVNSRDGSVNIIDSDSLTVTSTVELENGAAAIALSPDGTKGYVANELSDSVSVIDLQSQQVVARIPTRSRPHGLSISPDGRRLYVCNMGSNSLSIFNLATLGLVRDVTVGINPFNVVVSPDGRWAWVANSSESDPSSSTISVVDTGALAEVSSIAVGTSVRGLSISADGTKLYYSLELNNQISVLDTASKQVTARLTTGGRPYCLSLPQNGTTLWSADVGTRTATSFDVNSGQRLSQLDLGDGATPHAIVLAPDGRNVYVVNATGNELIVIRTDTAPGLRINSVSISGKNLIVNGGGFDNGAKILLDGVQQKTLIDEDNPTTILIGKKVGKQIARGQIVVVVVRNSDGSQFNSFNFTRP